MQQVLIYRRGSSEFIGLCLAHNMMEHDIALAVAIWNNGDYPLLTVHGVCPEGIAVSHPLDDGSPCNHLIPWCEALHSLCRPTTSQAIH